MTLQQQYVSEDNVTYDITSLIINNSYHNALSPMTNKRIISFPKYSLNMYKDTRLEFGTDNSRRSRILLCWVTVVKSIWHAHSMSGLRLAHIQLTQIA